MLAPVMTDDLEKYRPEIQRLGIPFDQQDEVIHILWRITGAIADSAFGITRPAEPAPLSQVIGCREEAPNLESKKNGALGDFAAATRNDDTV